MEFGESMWLVFSFHIGSEKIPDKFCVIVVTNFDSCSGVAGDGRCLFRSVVHGAWLRSGKQSPSDSLQKELADELRVKV